MARKKKANEDQASDTLHAATEPFTEAPTAPGFGDDDAEEAPADTIATPEEAPADTTGAPVEEAPAPEPADTTDDPAIEVAPEPEPPAPEPTEEERLQAQVTNLLKDRDDLAAALVAAHDVVLAREAAVAELEGQVSGLTQERGALQLALNVAQDEVATMQASLDDRVAKHLFQVVGHHVPGQRQPARHYVVARDVGEATTIATGRGKIAAADIATVVASVPNLIF